MILVSSIFLFAWYSSLFMQAYDKLYVKCQVIKINLSSICVMLCYDYTHGWKTYLFTEIIYCSLTQLPLSLTFALTWEKVSVSLTVTIKNNYNKPQKTQTYNYLLNTFYGNTQYGYYEYCRRFTYSITLRYALHLECGSMMKSSRTMIIRTKFLPFFPHILLWLLRILPIFHSHFSACFSFRSSG